MAEILALNWSVLFSQTAPLLVLAGAAMLILMAEFFPMPNKWPLVLLALLAITASFILVVFQWQGYVGAISDMALLSFDRITIYGSALLLAVSFVVTLIAAPYLSEWELPMAEFLVLFLLAIASMIFMISSTNLLVIFVGIEGMSLASYVMAAYQKRELKSTEAGLKYFIIGAAASAFLVFGMAFCFGATGSLDMVIIHQHSLTMTGSMPIYLLIGVVALIVGFGFKIALFPFHYWAPDVYEGAPLPVTAFFASAVKVVTFIVLFRLTISLFSLWGIQWEHLATAMALATMFFGNLGALAQSNIKRMLAYSSIAHVGYAAIALVLTVRMGNAAFSPLMFYITGYVIMTIGAFAVLMALGGEGAEKTELSDVAGLGMRNPALAALLSLFLVSLAGVPPTIGFFAKYYLFSLAVQQGFIWLIIFAVINSVISVAYYVRPIVHMYFRLSVKSGSAPVDMLPSAAVNYPIRLTLALSAVGVLIGGLFPSHLFDLVRKLVG